MWLVGGVYNYRLDTQTFKAEVPALDETTKHMLVKVYKESMRTYYARLIASPLLAQT